MFCGTCGNQMPDEVKFCPNCGTATAAQAAGQPQQQPYQQPYPPQQPYPQQPYGQQPYQQPYQPQPYYQPPPPPPDIPSKGLNAASFFFPIVGFIVYGTSHAQTPLKAKAALKWALISIGFWVFFGIVMGVVFPLLMYSIM